MKLTTMALTTLLAASTALPTLAADYTIDKEGAHAGISFRIKHLGYSWLSGRFDDFSGSFTFDENAPENSTVSVEINTASINSNHGQRDNHLRSGDFLDTGFFETASFNSTAMEISGETAMITGDLTLHGVTKSITINAEYVGAGDDPWGGYRAGFTGTTTLTLADFDMNFNLGPASTEVHLILDIEGVRN